MTPNILNVCPRCHSPEINIDHKSGNAGCSTCGKACRVYELWLFFPNEEEHRFLRNPMREMAGSCAELSGASLAKALDSVLTRFGVRMNVDVRRQVLSHVVAEAFKELYHQTFTFLPEETKRQVTLVSELIQKYTMEVADGIGGQAGEPAQHHDEDGGCTGEAGQEPGGGPGADAGDAGGPGEAGAGPGTEEAGVPVKEPRSFDPADPPNQEVIDKHVDANVLAAVKAASEGSTP